MATILPANRIKNIKVGTTTSAVIVPSMLTDASSSFALSAPTLSADAIIATNVDISTLSSTINTLSSTVSTLSASSIKYTDLGNI